jgi:hypothetical protein
MIGVFKSALGSEVIFGIAKAKTDLQFRNLKEYEGDELNDPEVGKRGAKMFEAYVGHDRHGGKGKYRLVLLVQSGQLKAMYYSNNHYWSGSWVRIKDF